MRKMEIIIKPEKLGELKDVLNESGISVRNILAYWDQTGIQEVYRGTKASTLPMSNIKVETVVKDSIIGKLVEKIKCRICNDNIGDGKIFIYMVQDAIRISTGEFGEDAI